MKRLYRSRTDKIIAGICGGIAEAYDLDPSLVRLVLVFLCLVTVVVPLALTYIVGWLVIPEKVQE